MKEELHLVVIARDSADNGDTYRSIRWVRRELLAANIMIAGYLAMPTKEGCTTLSVEWSTNAAQTAMDDKGGGMIELAGSFRRARMGVLLTGAAVMVLSASSSRFRSTWL